MRRFLEGRGGLAALTFVLGAVVASAATAGAASLITGKQIKDGSITAGDLSKGLRAQLKRTGLPGPQGPKGDPGPRGADGAAGAAGPERLTTASIVHPYYATEKDVVTIPGIGKLTSQCDPVAPFFVVTFRNQSGRTLLWERANLAGTFSTEATGTSAAGDLIPTGFNSANVSSTIQVSAPGAPGQPAINALIRIAEVGGPDGCHVSVVAIGG